MRILKIVQHNFLKHKPFIFEECSTLELPSKVIAGGGMDTRNPIFWLIGTHENSQIIS